MDYINIALPKGRIGNQTIELLEKTGMAFDKIHLSSRKLVLVDETNKIRFFMVKPSDVPTYVEYGAADIGISGKDTLLEEGRNLFEVLDLGFGACKMVVAGPVDQLGNLNSGNYKRVATKYPEIARSYFEKKKNKSIEVIKLNGSVELAPLVGLSEFIVDIVESGKTLKENGLVVFETIAEISARLVVNRASFKMKNEMITELIDKLKTTLEKS